MAVPKAVKRQVGIGKALQRVFDSPDGKMALVYLMQKGGLLHAAHEEVPGLNDYNNGRRSVVLELMADLRYDYNRLLELSQARLDENDGQE